MRTGSVVSGDGGGGGGRIGVVRVQDGRLATGGQTPLLHFLLESSILGSLQTTLKQGFQSTYIRPGMPSNHGCPQLHTVAKTFTLKEYDVLSTSNTYKVYYGHICSVF